MKPGVVLVTLVPWVVLGAWSNPALAQDAHPDGGMLSAGYIHSFVWGHSPAAGNGVEVSYEYYADRYEPIGVGTFLQLEDYSGTRREAFGLQTNFWFVGAEVGWAHRGSDATHASTHGLHLGLFASTGFLLASFRVVPPLSTLEPNHGTELSLTLGLKFFFTLHGQMPETIRVPHGRPLRVRGVACTTRDASSSGWQDAADAEYESIASFAALALDLLRHGAPQSLVRACHQAAREELRHTEYCLKRCEGGHAMPGMAELLAGHRPCSFEQLVRSCVIDGCLGEGFAARRASLAAERLEPNSGLVSLARDEANHARLAWRILVWAYRTSPQTCARALEAALEECTRLHAPEDEAYGVLAEALGVLAFEMTRNRVSTRIARLLRQKDSGQLLPLPA